LAGIFIQSKESFKLPAFSSKEILQDKTLRLWNLENTENIPMVMEKRKAMGIRVSTVSVIFVSYTCINKSSSTILWLYQSTALDAAQDNFAII
jgi:hypothetical protein